MGGSSSKQSSSFVTRALPGMFGTTDPRGKKGTYEMSSQIGGQALDLAGQAGANWGASPYVSQLNDLLSGNLGSITDDATNRAILNELRDVTAGRNAARGLSVPTQAAYMESVAPELAAMRSDTMGRLMDAETQQFMQQLGTAQMLQSLAQDAMPQTVAGNQGSGSSSGFQLCCFIFMEAYDGRLLDVVRRYRDEHLTERNRRGYYKMADVIVPLMKKYKPFKKFVKLVMTDPMVEYGEWYYGRGDKGILSTTITKFWLKTFDILGGDKPYTRKNGEVI